MVTVRRTQVLIAAFILAMVVAGFMVYGLLSHRSVGEELLTEPEHRVHVVRLTADGFSPAEITIRKGDSIEFVTTLDTPFWPASNLHPTHTLYAAFDPQAPVYPDTSWSFTFDQPGRWKYHNHLDPQKTGVVQVLSEDGKLVQDDIQDCTILQGTEKLQCIDQTLERYLREEDINAAFSYFVSIYKEDTEIPSVCHGWAHRLGEVAYEQYKEGKEVPLTPEATFCSYGFYHGFIGAMVYDTQSLQRAQQFCEDAVSATDEHLRGLLSSCIHGIGHSISTLMLEKTSNWGDIPKLINRGREACEELYEDEAFLSMCYDGLFHELILSAQDESYGIQSEDYFSHHDLFYYCRELSGSLAESCLYDFAVLWPYFFNEDKNAAIEYVIDASHKLGIPPQRILRTLARSFVEFEIASGIFEDSVAACTGVPDDLSESCIEGLAAGFVTHGEPNRMHEAGFQFCRTSYEGDQLSLCMEKMIDELSGSYSQSQMVAACDVLASEERPVRCDNY